MTQKNDRFSTNELGDKIYLSLPKVFTERELEKTIDQFQSDHELTYPMRSGIINRATKIPLIWNKRGSIALHHLNNDFDELDVIYALIRNLKRAYASHISALYFNGLLEQKPKNHYISQAIKIQPAKDVAPLKPLIIMQAFMKEPRVTSNFFSYEKNSYYLLEKGEHTLCGVTSKRLHFQSRNIEVKVTDIERTLIDCIMAPHYSGGIPTIVNAYTEAIVQITKLKEYYDTLNPIYPYWQSIGLFLDAISPANANLWYELFRTHKKQSFFIDHNYNSTWEKSKRWEVSFPRSLHDYFNHIKKQHGLSRDSSE